MSRFTTFSLLILGLGFGACVSSGTYQTKQKELEALQRSCRDRDQTAVDQRSRLEAELARVNGELAALGRKLASVSFDRDVLRDVHDSDVDLLSQLKRRLDSLGQNVETLTAEKGAFAAAVVDAQTRLQELQRQRAAAEERAATFQELVRALQAMISAGTLEVTVRQGRMLIVLPNDVLFDSGRTEVSSAGRTALTQVARALSRVKDRRFTVIGHTDDVPIHTVRFRSNWDLSAARAVEVTLFLVSAGLAPETLGAAGHSQFDPIDSNQSEAGRAKNRRVEIALEPRISELPPPPATSGLSSR
jgi:chemotaxis protein MotB